MPLWYDLPVCILVGAKVYILLSSSMYTASGRAAQPHTLRHLQQFQATFLYLSTSKTAFVWFSVKTENQTHVVGKIRNSLRSHKNTLQR